MRLAAALIALGVVARLLTWNPVAHGDRARHVKVTLVGGAAAAVVAIGARAQLGPRTRSPLFWATAAMIAADATHYGRLAHPVSRGAPLISVGGDLGDEASLRRGWDVDIRGFGSARVSSDSLLLESPSGSGASIAARVPPVPDAQRNWLLPVGLLERERGERVAWRAAIYRTGDFYVVAELRRLLVQAVSYGIHVTYPDERDQLRGHEIPHPAVHDGIVHEWVVERTPRQVVLTLDGRQIWSAVPREPITQVRLGESKTDPSHGGAMRLERATYAVSLERA